MNKEEILKMPAGRELDILILRDVMKWTPIYVSEDSIFGTPGELDGWYDEKGTFRPLGTSPSTDNSIAILVAEKLQVEPFAWSFELANVEGGIVYWALLWGDNETGGIDDYSASADTFALVVCRTALLFAEGKKDNKR